jgi:hypothetical protein
VHKADNLTAICEPTVKTVGSLTSHNPIGLHGLLQDSIALFVNLACRLFVRQVFSLFPNVYISNNL